MQISWRGRCECFLSLTLVWLDSRWRAQCSDVNKDLTFKAKDKDQTLKAMDQDKDKDQTPKDKDQTFNKGQGLGQLWGHRPHEFIFARWKCQPSLDNK